MGTSIYFPLCALFFCILTLCIFFGKKHVSNYETKLYGVLLVTNFIGLILEILCTYASYIHNDMLILSNFILKAYLFYNILWTLFLLIYVILITFSVDKISKIKNNINIVFATILILSVLLLIVLPIELVVSDDFTIRYTTGPSVNFSYYICGIFMFIMFMVTLINYKNITIKKKYIPVLVFWIVGIISMVLQFYYPSLLILTFAETLILSIMYHTIENPDIKLIEQLNVAKDAAERANSAKSDFLSSMSHEIRTPLNAIVGFSNGLLESNDLPETAKGDVKNIIMASDNLLELVNGILDISKIEAGKLEIIDVNYSFHKIFDELVLLTKARLGEKPLDFRYAYDSSVPEYLYGDGTRVKQIVLNLLTNAVKYTKTGYVDFKVNSVIRGDVVRLIICVEDSGIGIKKESIEKLFTKFERLDVEKNSTIEGTGLGLAITKKLTEMMGGTIVVQSVYGQGSKFTVSIDQKIVTGEELEKLKRENDNSVNAEEVVDGHGKRILVVDDNNLNIKVAERLLGKFNVVIDSCSSGFDCVNKITSGEKYDLLLLDDMMPKMSGTETLHKLKEVNGFNTPVIVLTANAITGMREKYLSEGFDDYLSKPIEKDELKRVIKQYLG